MTETLSALFSILAVSFIFSAIVSRIPWIRIPTTAAYLIFGILLRYRFMAFPANDLAWIHHLGDFGLLFLMYISGLEVDLRQLNVRVESKNRTSPLMFASLMFFSTLLLSFGFAVVLSKLLPEAYNPYFFAVLLSTTSLGVIMPILEEAALLHSYFGQTLLVSAIFADFFTMLLLSLFVSAHSSTTFPQVLATFTVIPAIGLVYLVLVSLQRWPRLRVLFGDAQARIRGVLALFGAATLLADFTGAEPILGGFLVGMLVSSLSFQFKKTIKDYSHGIGYGFFIPMFFISVGLNYNLNDLASPLSLFWVGLFSLVAFLVKALPALTLRKRFGWRASLASGFLLSARLSLIVAAAEIGVKTHLVSSQFAGYIILVGLLTSIFAPIAFLTTLSTRIRHRLIH